MFRAICISMSIKDSAADHNQVEQTFNKSANYYMHVPVTMRHTVCSSFSDFGAAGFAHCSIKNFLSSYHHLKHAMNERLSEKVVVPADIKGNRYSFVLTVLVFIVSSADSLLFKCLRAKIRYKNKLPI